MSINPVIYQIAKIFKILPIKPDLQGTTDPGGDSEPDSTLFDDIVADIKMQLDLDQTEVEGWFAELVEYLEDKSIDNLAKIFDIDDLSLLLDNLGSSNWANIFSINDFQNWLGQESGFLDAVSHNSGFKKFILDILCRIINGILGSIPLNPYQVAYDDELDKIYFTTGDYNDDEIEDGYFTLELCLYRVIRSIRSTVVKAIQSAGALADRMLPNAFELFLPFFSGMGIRLAYKQNGAWIFDIDEWPDTYDPVVYHGYFKLPHIPLLDICFTQIPNYDLSKVEVYFKTGETYTKSRKYKLLDLMIDILGFGSLILVSYILTNIGMKKDADSVLSEMSTSPLNKMAEGALVVNNTVQFNRTILSNMAGVLALMNGLFTSAANVQTMNDYLAGLHLPEMPELDLEPVNIDRLESDVSDLQTSLTDVIQKLTNIKTILDSQNMRHKLI